MPKSETLPANAVPGVAPDLEPDVERREAFLAAYFETGSQTKAIAVAGVHMNTSQKWLKSAWFQKALRELKREKDKQLDGRITKILTKTLESLADRIENGDEKVLVTKQGMLRAQQKMSGKDLAIVTGVLFDKRAQLRKEPEQDDDASSALDRIADKLRQYAVTEKLGRPEVVDVEAKAVQDDGSDLV